VKRLFIQTLVLNKRHAVSVNINQFVAGVPFVCKSTFWGQRICFLIDLSLENVLTALLSSLLFVLMLPLPCLDRINQLAEVVAAAFQPFIDVSKRFGSQFTLVCHVVRRLDWQEFCLCGSAVVGDTLAELLSGCRSGSLALTIDRTLDDRPGQHW
jgi:hypothetical protein